MGVFDNLMSFGSGVLNTVTSNFSAALSNANTARNNAVNAVQSVVTNVQTTVQQTANNVQRNVQNTVNTVAQTANGSFSNVNTAVNNFQTAANTAGQEANRAVQQAQAVAQQAMANANAADILRNAVNAHPVLLASNMAQSLLYAATPAKSSVVSPRAASNDWYLTYSAVDQSGKQTSQTWMDTTGKQSGFAGIDAAGLATYYAEKGNAEQAAMYQEIAKASSQNAVLQAQAGTKGTYYDIQPGIFSKSKSEISEIIRSQYPGSGVSTLASQAAGVTPTGNANLIDSIIGVRNGAYETGGKNIAAGINTGNAGTILSGVGTSGMALAADVIAPLDLINVANLWFTGRGDQISGDDLMWAGIDALAVVAGTVSFGAGYAGIKGIKTAAKATKGFAYGGQALLGGTALIGGLS